MEQEGVFIFMNIDSIIFDLDGTLWDSTEGIAKSWTKVLEKKNYYKKEITVEELQSCIGKQLYDMGKILFPDLDEKTIETLIDDCCKSEEEYLLKHGGVLYGDLEENLRKLSSKYKLFIVSNCQDGYIECFLKAHNLEDYFVDFECPGRTGLSKGENIKLIIERNNLKSPVYVGDTQTDADSTRVANIPFVFARYGFGDVDEYEYVIDTFEELLELNL